MLSSLTPEIPKDRELCRLVLPDPIIPFPYSWRRIIFLGNLRPDMNPLILSIGGTEDFLRGSVLDIVLCNFSFLKVYCQHSDLSLLSTPGGS